MSFGTGPPAPPPLRRSRWSWWKPVKGTSANADYYYNVNTNTDTDSRPGSSSSTIRPGSSGSSSMNPSKVRTGRNSLSVLDDKRAEILRGELLDYMQNGPPASTRVTTATTATSLVRCDEAPSPVRPTSNSSHADTSSNPGGRVPPRKNNRKSTSR